MFFPRFAQAEEELISLLQHHQPLISAADHPYPFPNLLNCSGMILCILSQVPNYYFYKCIQRGYEGCRPWFASQSKQSSFILMRSRYGLTLMITVSKGKLDRLRNSLIFLQFCQGLFLFSRVALGVINDLFMVADSGDRIILVYRKTFDTFDQGHSNQQIKTSGWVGPFGSALNQFTSFLSKMVYTSIGFTTSYYINKQQEAVVRQLPPRHMASLK